jgi:acyl-CoA synthetase (AMP-forming)/AMP-acid ligase II
VETNANVARHLRQHAFDRPFAAAVKTPVSIGPEGEVAHHALSFRDLDRLTDAAARVFRAAGIAPGTRTLLALKPGEPLILGFYGLLKAGAVPVLIDPGMGARAALACVARTQPEALVGTLKAVLMSHLPLRALASLRLRVAFGTRGWSRSLEGALSATPGVTHPAEPDDLAAILFTSGSTGSPKGVRYTHGMLEAQLRLIRASFALGPGDIDLPLLPAFSAFNPALGATTVSPWLDAAQPAAGDPRPILEAIRGERVTSSFGSPTLWDRLAREAEARGLTLPSLRLILTAGAPVPPGLVERLRRVAPNATVHTPYGATECLPVSTLTGKEILEETGDAARRGRGTCVGRPVAGVEIRVVRDVDGPLDSLESATPCAPGEVGEVLATGPTVTREYDRLPEATRLSKCRDAAGRTWHRMGDLGALDPRGRLWFHGRRVEALATAQGRLTTESVEPAFADHPAVARCALVGIGPVGSQEPVLVVEARRFPRGRLEASNLASELRQHAAANPLSLRVRRVVFQRRLPVDVRHNAKIHRLKLTAHWAGRVPINEGDTDARERWPR